MYILILILMTPSAWDSSLTPSPPVVIRGLTSEQSCRDAGAAWVSALPAKQQKSSRFICSKE